MIVEPAPIVAPAPISTGATSSTPEPMKDIVADRRLVFVDAVVITSDRSRAHIDARSDFRVADVSQMIDFATVSDGALFNFNKIANLHVVG